MAIDLILGTAGHIDHGKTSLVRALTGVDTDRLPEEKQRGITIDLGFAELCLGPYRLGIVDVPGHERYVRNMLAGATGMDVGLLVVAADDSIKPQTREHLEIFRLLDLPAGVIALTKCDLVEPAWAELVEEEIRALVQGSFLESAPVVRTSCQTGAGISELRDALTHAAQQSAQRRAADSDHGPFRMAIDRAFTIVGHGTVVTGSVSSGRAAVGDELQIEPGAVSVRVRGLQNHDRAVPEVHRGQRAAINLVGIHHESIARGQELSTPGHLQPSRLLSVRLRAADGLPRALKPRSRVRVHVGTAEVLAALVLLDAESLSAGETCFAQLLLREPAVTTWRQPFVVRSESPLRTIGGGHVLVPAAARIRHLSARLRNHLAALDAAPPAERAAAALYFAGLKGWQPTDLVRTAGITDYAPLCAALAEQGRLCTVPVSPTRTLQFHHDHLEQVCLRLERLLHQLHQRHPLRLSLDRQQVRQGCERLEDAVFDRALAELVRTGRVRVDPRGIALAGHGPQLSANERKLLTQLIDDYRQAGFESPTVKELQQRASRNQAAVPQLVVLAAAQGDLVAVTQEYYLHVDVDRAVRAQLAPPLADGAGLTVSEIREILKTSRKYAVPYCEYLDRIGFTRRDGDRRWLAAAAGSAE